MVGCSPFRQLICFSGHVGCELAGSCGTEPGEQHVIALGGDHRRDDQQSVSGGDDRCDRLVLCVGLVEARQDGAGINDDRGHSPKPAASCPSISSAVSGWLLRNPPVAGRGRGPRPRTSLSIPCASVPPSAAASRCSRSRVAFGTLMVVIVIPASIPVRSLVPAEPVIRRAWRNAGRVRCGYRPALARCRGGG